MAAAAPQCDTPRVNRSRALLTTILSIVCACTQADSKSADPPTPESVKASATADASKCHDGIDALTELEGKTEAELLELYGQPREQRAFTMADCCHEFEIELHNTYPPGKGHDAVEIHELTWHDGTKRLTAWAHDAKSNWVILDTLCYDEGDEF